MDRYDVVVVGGGIGGAGCATVLARAGLDVCMLEPTLEYPDIVRGEWLAPWGCEDARAIGLYDVLARADGHTVSFHITYDEGVEPELADKMPLPLNMFVPDVAGPLCVRHPVACQALADAAVGAGATMHRGVSNIDRSGDVVSFSIDGARHEVTARLVIGADGRASPLRKSLGINMHKAPTQHYLGGILVEGVDWLPDDTQFVATEDGLHVLLFPQGGDRVRLYLAYPLEQRDRYAGPERAAAILQTFSMSCWPGSSGFPSVEIIGPAHSYRSIDTWVDEPFADRVVLVGDAAGYNDPIIGQGLSITMRDVRLVTEALLGSDAWNIELFEPYAAERLERMRRLRLCAQVHSVLVGGQGAGADPDVRARLREDPRSLMVLGTEMMGPDKLPAEVFDEESLAALIRA